MDMMDEDNHDTIIDYSFLLERNEADDNSSQDHDSHDDEMDYSFLLEVPQQEPVMEMVDDHKYSFLINATVGENDLEDELSSYYYTIVTQDEIIHDAKRCFLILTKKPSNRNSKRSSKNYVDFQTMEDIDCTLSFDANGHVTTK